MRTSPEYRFRGHSRTGQFPSYHGYNPTETIWAMAYLTSDHILGRPLMTSPVAAHHSPVLAAPRREDSHAH